MPNRKQLACVTVAAIGVVRFCSLGLAQDVVSSYGSWTLSTPPPAVPDGIVSSGNTAGLTSGFLSFNEKDVGLVRAKGTVTSTTVIPPDAFAVHVSREQTFSLAEPAVVAIPSFLNGGITFNEFTPLCFGTFSAKVSIHNLTGSEFASVEHGGGRFAHEGNVSVADKFLYNEVALPAGDYKIRAFLRVAGEGNRAAGTPEGNNVTVNFFDGTTNGLATSVAAYPAGLGNSRAAVNAIAARAEFSVDGTGVQVGVLEPGMPYEGHSSLSGAGKLTIVSGDESEGWRDEHPLATAGIIAGADANDAHAGVAPGATILATPTRSYPGLGLEKFRSGFNRLLAENGDLRVINFSAGLSSGDSEVEFTNKKINEKPNLTFVMAAGNDGEAGTIGGPGLAHNIITVGAVNRTFERRAEFSSYGSDGAVPMKPDLVAPGEYIASPQARDVNGNGLIDDFGRVFLGDDFRYTVAQGGGGASTADISGTSFAAPLVSGAVALLHQFQMKPENAATHDADHRVIKAVLLNSARTNVRHLDGTPWRQTLGIGGPEVHVVRSLDAELGAGMLDCLGALRQYQPDEIRIADDNTAANFNIAAASAGAFLWDLEQVTPGTGKVNYLLGDVSGAPLRATLTWDFDQLFETGLQPLELRLYEEGADPGNPPGFDPLDLLIARTDGVGENVKLFDFASGVPDLNGTANFYLQVINAGSMNATYGLAVFVPEPTCAWALILISLATGLRRTRATRLVQRD
jgi:hypothetical protein